MATMNAALLIVTAMAMRAGGRKAFGLCKAPAQALSLSPYSSLSLQKSLQLSLSLSLQSVLGFNVLCSPCPCRYFACLACAFCTCLYFVAVQNEKVLWPQGQREGGQCCWLMTCGLNFPYTPHHTSTTLLSPMVFCPTTFVLL